MVKSMVKRTYQATDLSKFLRKSRKQTNLSTADVAQLTSQLSEEFRISSGFLSQIEHGATPSVYKLLTLSRLYKVPIIEFFRAIGATEEEIGIQSFRITDQGLLACHQMLDILLHDESEDSEIRKPAVVNSLFLLTKDVSPETVPELEKKLFNKNKGSA